MLPFLITAAAVIVVLVLARWLKRQPPRVRRKYLLYAAIAVLVALAATGRLHWLAAVVGAALPLLYKLIALARFAPLFTRVFHHFNFGSQGHANFQSRSLLLEVNPLTGTVDGRILAGRFKGRRLSSLGHADLDALMEEFQKNDPQAAELLQSYHRMHSQHAGGGEARQAASSGLSEEEAWRILGLKPGAAREAIIEAHRRLIQRLHPDRGGSAHLAALINQAKDLLLK